MATSLVLTALGTDRSGIVAALSTTIADHEGSWMESRIARLAGRFACILRVSVPDARAGDLRAALLAAGSQGLNVAVDTAGRAGAAAGPAAAGHALDLHLIGQDRPGIVREVSQALAGIKANIDEMTTKVVDASMSGETLFVADARVRVPEHASVAELKSVLEGLADELMVDINLEEPPTI